MTRFLFTAACFVFCLMSYHPITATVYSTVRKDEQNGHVAIHDLISAAKLLSVYPDVVKAGDSLNWRRKTEEGEKIRAIGVTLDCDGIDPASLTTAEDSFVEDVVLFAFNKVTWDMDFSGFAMHLTSKSDVEGLMGSRSLADTDVVKQNVRSGAGAGASASAAGAVPRRLGFKWTYNGSYGCRFCPNDRRVAATATVLTSDEDNADNADNTDNTSSLATGTGLDAATVTAWEQKVSQILHSSQFAAFEMMGMCTITLGSS